MAAARSLRDAAQLVGPAVETMITALEPPQSDAALVALVRRQARVIDGMGDEVAVAMLPNHTGQLLKALAELEERARKRREKQRPAKLNPVQQLRAEYMADRRGKLA